MTLQKMYLVPADASPPPPQNKSRKLKRKTSGSYDKWVQFRENMKEREAKQAMQLKSIAEILKKVLPDTTSRAAFIREVLPASSVDEHITPQRQQDFEMAGPSGTLLLKRKSTTSTTQTESDYDVDDDDVARVKEEEDMLGHVTAPYNGPFLDTQYGIRKEGDIFKIGDSTVSVDSLGDITIKGKQYRGTEGLWELLTRNKVKREKLTPSDYKTYKSILEKTNAHREHYEPGGNIQFSPGANYRRVIRRKLFGDTQQQQRGVESKLQPAWLKL